MRLIRFFSAGMLIFLASLVTLTDSFPGNSSAISSLCRPPLSDGNVTSYCSEYITYPTALGIDVSAYEEIVKVNMAKVAE